MKNDTFFNWLIIIISLMLAIGMFMKGLPYWWVAYLVSVITLARYTDFLESKEKELEVIPFPIKKWSDPVTPEEYSIINAWELPRDLVHCKECGYVYEGCVCKPMVNNHE